MFTKNKKLFNLKKKPISNCKKKFLNENSLKPKKKKLRKKKRKKKKKKKIERKKKKKKKKVSSLAGNRTRGGRVKADRVTDYTTRDRLKSFLFFRFIGILWELAVFFVLCFSFVSFSFFWILIGLLVFLLGGFFVFLTFPSSEAPPLLFETFALSLQ